jgi:6-phospho-3-hexuloisomerase
MVLHESKKQMIGELESVFLKIKDDDIVALSEEIAIANRVFIYGLGRERLMLQAFAMRLMHLGVQVHMVGDVTTPGVAEGDLFLTSSGTGYLSTVEALLKIVNKTGARVAFMTANPEEPLPRMADLIIPIPAQTMKDKMTERKSLQPMGALFEQAQLLMLELIVILLKEKLAQSEKDMETRHTNLE